MPSIVFWKRKLEYVISNSSQCANNLLLKQESVSGDKFKLLTQNVLLLQSRLEKEIKRLKDKLKKDLKSANEKTKGDLQKMKVSFPT